MNETIPARGYYRLTEEVANPRPDRRSKRWENRPTWASGTRVFVSPPTERVRGYIVFPDGGRVLFGEPHPHFPEISQGNGVLLVLEAVPATVGQVLEQAWAGPRQLIARAVDLGKLTLDDLRQFDAELSAWDEPLLDEFDKVHEI